MTTLFKQPAEAGIAGNFFVPVANKVKLPVGQFGLQLWQRNPFTSDGLLVPDGYDMSAMTGFKPAAPLKAKQLGFNNTGRSSVAQMDGETVGAYINSADLPGSPDGQKMMITPQYSWTTPPTPFAGGTSLHASMGLQVPTASGNPTYVSADFLFDGPAGALLSFGVKLFANGSTHPIVGTGYDAPSNNYMLNSPLGIDQTYVTRETDSGEFHGSTWLGFEHFHWSVSQAQFAAGLKRMATDFPGHFPSTDPEMYQLSRIHLNAEFHFGPNPATLGWSMRNLTVSQS